jgi:hypothetical protein
MSVDCSDGEPVDDYESVTRRAKTETSCTACGQPIERGQLYHHTSYSFDGDDFEHRRCARCEAMFRFLQPCVNELSGDETVDPDLDCGHVWSDNFEGEPPLAVQALAFLTPAEAQVLIASKRFSNQYVDLMRLQGPIEPEEHRIARLLRRILGERFPLPTGKFCAIEREDREESNGW